MLRRWADGGKGAGDDTPIAGATLLGLQSRQTGGVFFCAGDPSWGAVGSDNQTVYRQESPLADFRDNTEGFLISGNGATVRFGTQALGKAPAQFSLAQRVYGSGGAGNDAGGLVAPVTQAPGLDVQGWHNGRSPTLNGKPLPLSLNEQARCLAVAPGGQQFVLGTEWNVRCFDKSGQAKWSVTAPGTTWAVNVAPNGKTALAAFADGTIRWFRMSDGQELCALFPHKDERRWVLWTPSGYYDCSPGGENLIGWHLNHGPDEAADFFSASRFRDDYYRPVLISKILDSLGEAEALRQADAETGRKPAPPVAQTALPPVVTVITPTVGTAVSSGAVTLRYNVRTPSGQPVTGVRALIDGRPAKADRDLRLVSADTSTPDGATREISVPIPPHDCVVSLVAENSAGAGEPALVPLVWAGAAPSPQADPKPRLFVLAIGISKYNDTALTLNYPDKDAQSFAAALQTQKGQLYADVQSRVLVNAQASQSKIRDGLAWLRQQTTARDVAMIFLAGHGANDPAGRYLFIPADFDQAQFETTGVPFSDIKSTVENLPGKTLLFVDSCHSGNVLGSRPAIGAALDAALRGLCPTTPRPGPVHEPWTSQGPSTSCPAPRTARSCSPPLRAIRSRSKTPPGATAPSLRPCSKPSRVRPTTRTGAASPSTCLTCTCPTASRNSRTAPRPRPRPSRRPSPTSPSPSAARSRAPGGMGEEGGHGQDRSGHGGRQGGHRGQGGHIGQGGHMGRPYAARFLVRRGNPAWLPCLWPWPPCCLWPWPPCCLPP